MNRFCALPGAEGRRVEAGMPAHAALLGGPLLNDWGEVVGIISHGGREPSLGDAEEGTERCVRALAVEPLKGHLPPAASVVLG